MADWLDVVKPWTWPGHLEGGFNRLFGGQDQAAVRNAGAKYGAQIDPLVAALQQQATGRGPSLADATLADALRRNVAAQQSFAASARPGQTGMATRLAMQNAGNVGAQLGSAGALARLQEQQMAQQQLANLLLGARGQDIQAAVGASAIPGGLERFLGTAGGIAQIAKLASDKRLKKNIKDGRKDADALIRALKAHAYDYKDERFGKGRQLGIMAQALEKTPGGKQAVMDTPHGKMVDAAKLAGALAAAAGRLGERVTKLEKKVG